MIIKKIKITKNNSLFFIDLEIDRELFDRKNVKFIDIIKLQKEVNNENIIKYNPQLQSVLDNINDLRIEVKDTNLFAQIKKNTLSIKKDEEFNEIYYKNIFLRGKTSNRINAFFNDALFIDNNKLRFQLERATNDDDLSFIVLLFDQNKFIAESSEIFKYTVSAIQDIQAPSSVTNLFEFIENFNYNIDGFSYDNRNRIPNYSLLIRYNNISLFNLDFDKLFDINFIQTILCQNIFSFINFIDLESKKIIFDYYNSIESLSSDIIQTNSEDTDSIYKNIALVIKDINTKFKNNEQNFDFNISINNTEFNKNISINKNTIQNFLNNFNNQLLIHQYENINILCKMMPLFNNNIVFTDSDDNIKKIGIKLIIEDTENPIYSNIIIEQIFIKNNVSGELIQINDSVFSFNNITYNQVIDIKTINLLDINNIPLYLLNTPTTNFYNTYQYLKNRLPNNTSLSLSFKIVYKEFNETIYEKIIESPFVIEETFNESIENYTSDYYIKNIINNANYSTIFQEIRNSLSFSDSRLIINESFINEAINNLNFNIENVIYDEQTKKESVISLFNSVIFCIKIFDENMQNTVVKYTKLNFQNINNTIQSEKIINYIPYYMELQFIPFDKNISQYLFNINNNEAKIRMTYQILEFEKNANFNEANEISDKLIMNYTNSITIDRNKEKLFTITDYIGTRNINKLKFFS